MENYSDVAKIGEGTFAVTKLFCDKRMMTPVAIKMMKRGDSLIDTARLAREISNHQLLQHPNVVQFKEAFLTPTHVAIVMEYAQGGELFHYLEYMGGRLHEDEARCIFQQIVTGVGYCHAMGVCHRDLKLENVLRDSFGRIKICDFGYSKSFRLDSRPKTKLGTPSYIAPEVFVGTEYSGEMADVWACGVMLYVMLVGFYPFDDPVDSTNIREIVSRVMAVRYSIPDDVCISDDCRDLLSHIFVRDPRKRYGIWQIKKHAWFLKDLPAELSDSAQAMQLLQSMERGTRLSESDVKKIVDDARTLPKSGFEANRERLCV